jgi:hypothetical protein
MLLYTNNNVRNKTKHNYNHDGLLNTVITYLK